jgi:hypothetical protein
MALRSKYVYMLLPICAQFHYANGDSPYAKFLAFLPVRIWGVPVCVPGSVCDVSAIFPHTISLRIRGSPFANFVLISAACTPVPRLDAYRDPHLQILYYFLPHVRLSPARMHTGIPICNNLVIFSDSLDDF